MRATLGRVYLTLKPLFLFCFLVFVFEEEALHVHTSRQIKETSRCATCFFGEEALRVNHSNAMRAVPCVIESCPLGRQGPCAHYVVPYILLAMEKQLPPERVVLCIRQS